MDRWDGFFDDLEGRVEEQRRADELAGLADRVRRDRAGITLAARLAGVARSGVRVHVLGGEQVSGQVDEVMVDCVVLEDGGRRAVVPLASVVRVDRLGDRPGPLSLGDRPGLGRAVRDLARDRRPVRAHDVTGVVNEGVLDRVGQDHLDLLVVPADLTVRAAEGRSRTTVPFSALAVVRQL
ncbi:MULTISPECIES: hypothetical protein [Arsenicicoccus]|uniref:Uncharacterized protein n=1 Tax=Arsenicicoccus bolidensis TaxID=229480 RepID=A0ABS9Q4S6_9MICO|nr:MULTISPECIES: hypothetical protein [Arsenicicoccus]MCG7322874.1 hypothetical protein [Arsenicicoccus bolidensis]